MFYYFIFASKKTGKSGVITTFFFSHHNFRYFTLISGLLYISPLHFMNELCLP